MHESRNKQGLLLCDQCHNFIAYKIIVGPGLLEQFNLIVPGKATKIEFYYNISYVGFYSIDASTFKQIYHKRSTFLSFSI